MWYLHCHEKDAETYARLLNLTGVKEKIQFFFNPFDLREALQKEKGAEKNAKVALGSGTFFNLLDVCETLSKDGIKNIVVLKEMPRRSFLKEAYRLGAALVLSAKDTVEFLHLVETGDEADEKSFHSSQETEGSAVSFALDTSDFEPVVLGAFDAADDPEIFKASGATGASDADVFFEDGLEEPGDLDFLSEVRKGPQHFKTVENGRSDMSGFESGVAEEMEREDERKLSVLAPEDFEAQYGRGSRFEEPHTANLKSQAAKRESSYIEEPDMSALDGQEEYLPSMEDEVAGLSEVYESGMAATSDEVGATGAAGAIEAEAQIEANSELQYPHPLLAFCSVRGGVGKSAVSTMVALAAARAGKKVALVDLDLLFGNLFGYFGLGKPIDLTFYAENKNDQKLQQTGTEVADNLVLFGPCERPEFAELLNASIQKLLSVLSSSFELVVIDTSTSWGDVTATVAQTANKVCLMSDERCGAISSLGRGAELLFKLGVPRTNIIRLINRSDARNRDAEFFNRTSAGLERVPTLKIFDGGVSVSEFLSAGDAVSLLDIENVFSESCKKLTAQLLREVGALPAGDQAKEFFAEKKKSGSILRFAQRTFLKDAS